MRGMPDSLLIGVVIASAVAVSYWLTMGLASLFDRISRWSANRYARKMGYPTLVDVVKRFEPATKQDEGVPMRMPYVVPEIKSIDVSKLEPLP